MVFVSVRYTTEVRRVVVVDSSMSVLLIISVDIVINGWPGIPYGFVLERLGNIERRHGRFGQQAGTRGSLPRHACALRFDQSL
jgi:hypothetical protein